MVQYKMEAGELSQLPYAGKAMGKSLSTKESPAKTSGRTID
jgi:hypothetical protein